MNAGALSFRFWKIWLGLVKLRRKLKLNAAAEEEETLAKLRLEAIELEAEEKRIVCSSKAGSVVSGRSRRSVRSTSNSVSFKSSLIKNAEFKRNAEPAHGTEAGSKPEVGAMLLEHKARELRLRPLVTEPRPRSNEPQPMQFEQKRNSVTNVLTLSMRSLMLCLQMTNRLF